VRGPRRAAPPAGRGRAAPDAAPRPAGKTQCINHFLINGAWYLVDLPGYGYARRSKALRAEWSGFTQQYFLERATLANVLLLVDASVPVQALDLEVADWLGNAQVPFSLGPPAAQRAHAAGGAALTPGAAAQVPFSLVFTKTDKRKKGVPPPQENIRAFQARLL
jgi:GTP-binding protein